MLSNKFRKTSPGAEVLEDLHERIDSIVRAKKPLNLTMPTGGYKKWQFDSAPEVDWAEFFHLRFMFEYLSPILAVYEPGVVLDYYSNAWLIKKISHYPQTDLDKYTQSFRQLIAEFEQSFPLNFKVRFNVVTEQKNERILLRRILRNRPLVEKEWKRLSKIEQKKRLAISSRNIRWDLLEKNEKLSKKTCDKIIYEGKIIHDSLLKGGWNKDLDYLFNDNKIGIIHRSTKQNFLHLATYHGSLVQFWVAKGIIMIDKDKIAPKVLSYNQYKNLKPALNKMHVNLTGLSNLNQVEVLQF